MSKVTIAVRVFNHTNEDLLLESAHLEHGEWINRPEDIRRNAEGDFAMGSGCSHGIDGSVRWHGSRDRDVFSITVNKPVHGTTHFIVDSTNRYRYTVSGDPLDEHAHVSVSFYNQDFSSQSIPE